MALFCQILCHFFFSQLCGEVNQFLLCHLVAVLLMFMCFKFLDWRVFWKRCIENLWIAALASIMYWETWLVNHFSWYQLKCLLIYFFFWVEYLKKSHVALFVAFTAVSVSWRFQLNVCGFYNKHIAEQDLWDLLWDECGSGEGNKWRIGLTSVSVKSLWPCK